MFSGAVWASEATIASSYTVSDTSEVTSLTIELNDMYMSGPYESLSLKDLIKEQFSKIDLNSSVIVSTTITAKSRTGTASAELYVNGVLQDSSRIWGVRSDFNSRSEITFGSNTLKAQEYELGDWDIILGGDIKIRRILVVMMPVPVEDASL